MICTVDIKFYEFLLHFRLNWDFHLETREETVAESEREAAASTMAAMAMAAATGWNFGISRLSRGRHGVGVLSFSRAMTFSVSLIASVKYEIKCSQFTHIVSSKYSLIIMFNILWTLTNVLSITIAHQEEQRGGKAMTYYTMLWRQAASSPASSEAKNLPLLFHVPTFHSEREGEGGGERRER